jgi:N-acylneuraminate cytidylyltransferase/CMP-N,N'-diacetyllegionaminic acid synthase
MYKNNRILALITARGGSKGLPGKNILTLKGKPLIAWSIIAAQRSRFVDMVVVSTEDRKIASIAAKYKAEIPFLRPAKLSTDAAKSIDVVLHALNYLKLSGDEYDYVVLLEPTSPLREASDIDNAVEILLNNKVGAVSIVGVSKVESAHPIFDVKINKKGLLVPYRGSFKKGIRRQDISELYYFEGTLYISKISELIKRRKICHDKTLPYIVPRWKALEIDEMLDMVCAEAILNNLKKIRMAEK